MPINKDNAADILLSVSVGMLGVTSIINTRNEQRLAENQRLLLAKQKAERKFYTRVVAGFAATTALGAVNSMRLEKKIKTLEDNTSSSMLAISNSVSELREKTIQLETRVGDIDRYMTDVRKESAAGREAYNAAAANIGSFDTKLNAFGSEVIRQKQEQESIKTELANIRAMLTIGNQQK